MTSDGIDWTAVVLPDTQIYVRAYPEMLKAQVDWIVGHRGSRRIRFAIHEGDVTHDNSESQWRLASRALHRLDGHVPYVIATGNHDYGPEGCASTRETRLDEYFPAEEMQSRPSFGGTYEPDRLDNSYHLFDTPTGPWLVLALEFGPRDGAVEWAHDVLEEHPGIPTIVATHVYLYSDHTRYDRTARPDQKWSPHEYGLAELPGGVNDGEALWRKLVLPRSQIAFVLSGHVLNEGAARRTDVRPDGTVVHQLLANYQTEREGGAAFLRLLEFVEGGRKVRVRTYSPFLDEHKTDERNDFVLEVPGLPGDPA